MLFASYHFAATDMLSKKMHWVHWDVYGSEKLVGIRLVLGGLFNVLGFGFLF